MAYTKEQLQSIFQEKFNKSEWNNLLIEIFGKEKMDLRECPKNPDTNTDDFEGYYLGEKIMNDGLKIGFLYYELKIGSVVKKRVSLQNLVKSLISISGNFECVLAVFDDGTNWRVSFVSGIKDNATAPKRFTYLFGNKEYYHTACERFLKLQTGNTTFDDLMEAFSVEALTDDFYNEIYDWYLWASQTAKYPNGTVKDNKVGNDIEKWINYKNDEDEIKKHISRLIIRLIFVWFLKQKKTDEGKSLVPDDFFNEKKIKEDILAVFDENSKSEGNYYNAILQNLFFATLNRPIEYKKDGIIYIRDFAKKSGKKNDEHWGIKNLYRDNNNEKESFFQKEKETLITELFNQVPYLNGGLFECLDTENPKNKKEIIYRDGFSREKSRRAFLPNRLFFGCDKIILKKYKYSKKTKDWEDTKEPKKVEGILKILERYNWTIDENSPNDVDVALDPELLGNIFEKLLTSREKDGAYYTPKEIVNYMTEKSLNEYKGKLEDIRVLDPACGSGAFPMGMLNAMMKNIEMEMELSKEKRYAKKLEIITNCLYGVDINPIAVQITKLRFFISLLCEQTPTTKKKNFGIEVLPNLETKFVCADSLRNLGVSLPNKKELKEKRDRLFELRKEIVQAKSFNEKMDLREKDEELCKEIRSSLKNEEIIKSYIEEIKSLENDIKPPETKDVGTDLFGEKVIKIVDKDKEKRERIKYLKNQIKEIETIDSSESNFYKMLSWNPYDQNQKSDFFNPEWMFGLEQKKDPLNATSGGFDIVIGNPPYISYGLRDVGKMSPAYKKYLEENYKNSAEYKISIYAVFMQLAIRLCKNNGISSYIVPDSFLLGRYFSKVRNYTLEQCQILFLMLLKYRVFNADVGQSVIYSFKRTSNIKKDISVVLVNSRNELISKTFLSNNYPQSYYDSMIYNRFRMFFSKKIYDLVCKIDSIKNKSMIEAHIKFQSGLISKIGQNKIKSKNKINGKWDKGIFSGGSINKFFVTFNNEYLCYDSKLIKSGGVSTVKYFEPKLFLRQTGDKLICAYDRDNLLATNNVHIGT